TSIRIESSGNPMTMLPQQERELIYHDPSGRSYVVGKLSTRFYAPTILSSAVEMFWRFLVVFIVVLSVMLIGALLAFRRIVGRPLRRFQAAIAVGTPAAANSDL